MISRPMLRLRLGLELTLGLTLRLGLLLSGIMPLKGGTT